MKQEQNDACDDDFKPSVSELVMFAGEKFLGFILVPCVRGEGAFGM